jgi:hypothetical protein
MAHRDLKQKAIELRKKGLSYTQIKAELTVSKSTLSGWLADMPLSEKRIRELRDNSPIRIERYRNTMREKRQVKLDAAYKDIGKKIGKMSERDLFVSGFFLYWAEGTKTRNGAIEMTNTSPNMLKFFIHWLGLFNVPREKMKVHLHLYSDMNVKKQIQFWARTLSLPVSQFNKPYIKANSMSSITYKNGFGQGTCSISVNDARLSNTVLMALKYIQEKSV